MENLELRFFSYLIKATYRATQHQRQRWNEYLTEFLDQAQKHQAISISFLTVVLSFSTLL